jgi:hypothetical protein
MRRWLELLTEVAGEHARKRSERSASEIAR